MEEIIATEGVDALFVGPADLAAHMGHVGDSSHAEVVAAVDHVVSIAVAADGPNPRTRLTIISSVTRLAHLGQPANWCALACVAEWFQFVVPVLAQECVHPFREQVGATGSNFHD